jgi:TPR repeat protein
MAIENIEEYLAGLEDSAQKAEVLNTLGCFYLERKAKHEDEMEMNRERAREYFERADTLGQVDANHNLWLLNMVILSEVAEEFEYYGYRHEKGIETEDKGIPNIDKAKVMYEHALDHYNDLIGAFNAEPPRCYDVSEEYNKMIADNKQRAEINKQRVEIRLRDLDLGDKLYNAALESEKRVGNRKPDYARAIKRYQMAKARGDKRADEALVRLANGFFEKARSLSSDGKITEAIPVYEYAAGLGCSKSMAALGLLYETGEAANDQPDFKKAIKWYDDAIQGGSTIALINKAHLYETGEANNGVSNYPYAAALYKKAVDGGNKYAERKLRILEKKMHPSGQSGKREELIGFHEAELEADKENITPALSKCRYKSDFFKKRAHDNPEEGRYTAFKKIKNDVCT